MKIICVGRNYVDHIKELDNEIPSHPVIFLKPDSAILPPKQPSVIPEWSTDMHYETELILKIGKNGKYIQEDFALGYVSHYGLGVDFTERAIQNELKSKGLPWELSKGFDGSAVIGAWIPYTKDVNLQNLSFKLDINQKTVQEGNSSLMMYSSAKIISFVSQYYTLKTGDIIFTGTPKGVGNIKSGDNLIGYLEGKESFNFHIK